MVVKSIKIGLSALALALLTTGCKEIYRVDNSYVGFYAFESQNSYSNPGQYRITTMSDNGNWIGGCVSSSYLDKMQAFRARIKRKANGSPVFVSRNPYSPPQYNDGTLGALQLESLEKLESPSLPYNTKDTCVASINNSGFAVGYSRDNDYKPLLALLWKDTTSVIELRIPSSANFNQQSMYRASATSINNNNQIIGSYYSDPYSSNPSGGVAWDINGAYVGRIGGRSSKLNDSGEVISLMDYGLGHIYIDNYNNPQLYRSVDLVGFNGYATDINNNGTVVGVLTDVSTAYVPYVSSKSTTSNDSLANPITLPSSVQSVYDIKISNDPIQTKVADALLKNGNRDIVFFRKYGTHLLSSVAVGSPIYTSPSTYRYVVDVNDRGETLLSDGLFLREALMGDFNRDGCVNNLDSTNLQACQNGTFHPIYNDYPEAIKSICGIYDFNNNGTVDVDDVRAFGERKTDSDELCQ